MNTKPVGRSSGDNMNGFKAGFARADITPAQGTPVHGYYEPRYASGVLDPLQADVLALSDGSSSVLLISVDLCEFYADVIEPMRRNIAAQTGVPFESILIAATHNHTGPCLLSDEGAENYTMFGIPFTEDQKALLRDYRNLLEARLVTAAKAAMDDLQPAMLSCGTALCEGTSFVRRYRMKDGKIRTNPGIGNPDIVESLGQADTRLCVLKLQRETDSILLAHFGNHADTVGGSDISADWPGVMRKAVEESAENSHCMFFNGGEGNINHFDAQLSNPEYAAYLREHKDIMAAARYCGQKCAAAVLEAMKNAEPVSFGKVRAKTLAFAYPDKETGVEKTVELYGIAAGDVAILGIPGEPFAETAIALKKAGDWRMILPCSLANGFLDYFPTMDALDGSSYEARSCRFAPGIAEKIEEMGKCLLAQLKQKIV